MGARPSASVAGARGAFGTVAHSAEGGRGVQEEIDGVPGENAAYTDPKVGRRLLHTARQSLRLALHPGERVLGMFAVTRFRRSVTLLVVTDRRLLTLGDQHVGMPVVDEVVRADVVSLHVEREKVFTSGLVTATTDQGEVSLGTLTFGPDTFLRLEEVLARTDTAMPVIPTVPRWGEAPAGPGGREPGDDVGPRSAPVRASEHPLVAQLTALADLHDRGGLTDAEFTAAKARLLADPTP